MIYIDVQMPTNCYDCWIRQNMGCRIANDSGWLNDRRDDKCPLKAQEPRVMTLEEIKDYLDDPDGDKKPLWLEWHSIPALSGWVLASQVSDLMKRYMDSYNNTWRPWTDRPTDAQREKVKWK